MIARSIRYAGPNAAVRTLFGDLLERGDYEMLVNTANVAEFLEALRTTRYRSALRLQGKSITYALGDDWIARAERIARLQPANSRGLCLAYLAKLEVEALKTLLRGIAQRIERRRILSMLPPLPASSSLPINSLLATNTLQEAARALEHTRYTDVVKWPQTRSDEAPAGALFEIETALDRQFFAGLAAVSQNFFGSEAAIVGRLIGALADMFNILAAQRLRETFRLTPRAVARHLVPLGLRVRSNERQALCEWSGEGPAPIPFDRLGAASGLRVDLMRRLCSEATRTLFTVPFHAGLALAYILAIELEEADLLAIHEAKRWGVERGALAGQLIRFHGPALTGGPGV